jgi:RHS repeat-associated protein
MTKSANPSGYTLNNHYLDNVSSPQHGLRDWYSESFNNVTEKTEYTFDILKRLTSVKNAKGAVTDFYYDESHQPVRIKSGATNTYLAYDETGKVTQQTVFGNKTLNLKHTYFKDGNLKTISTGPKTESFTYDFAGRAETWNNGTSTTTYRYDKSGNLLNPKGKNLTFNGANEVIGFTYDDAGNLSKDDKYNYEWDQEGRLLRVTNLSGSELASYTYHPDGLRKTKKVGAATYHYQYDGSSLIRITDQSKATLWTITWANGKPVSFTNKAGVTYFYITNYRGDVIQIVDQNGLEAASYSYDPWGNVLSTVENAEITGQPLGYASYVYDRETKLYYLQARFYDPETARFISRDPDPGDSDDPKTQNGYTYADNNPVMISDPDGQYAQLVIYGGIAAYRGYKLYKSYKAIKKLNTINKVVKKTKGTGKNIVYTSKNKDGVVQYVGITNNFARRAAEHLNTKGIRINPLMNNLSRSDARAVEQVLIEIHKLGKNNGSLMNKINSISKNNPSYANQLRRGHKLLKSIGY